MKTEDRTQKAEKPILFSGEMVRAILAGRKTQTRRVMNPQPNKIGELWMWVLKKMSYALPNQGELYKPALGIWEACPYGAIGDRLWVRETFRCVPVGEYGISSVEYKADGKIVEIENTREAADLWFEAYRPEEKWRPSIFLPRWASRIALEIVNVSVERVQDISEKDAIAEGIKPEITNKVLAFNYLWDGINASRGFGWDVNPWVWVVEFKVVKG